MFLWTDLYLDDTPSALLSTSEFFYNQRECLNTSCIYSHICRALSSMWWDLPNSISSHKPSSDTHSFAAGYFQSTESWRRFSSHPKHLPACQSKANHRRPPPVRLVGNSNAWACNRGGGPPALSGCVTTWHTLSSPPSKDWVFDTMPTVILKHSKKNGHFSSPSTRGNKKYSTFGSDLVQTACPAAFPKSHCQTHQMSPVHPTNHG